MAKNNDLMKYGPIVAAIALIAYFLFGKPKKAVAAHTATNDTTAGGGGTNNSGGTGGTTSGDTSNTNTGPIDVVDNTDYNAGGDPGFTTGGGATTGTGLTSGTGTTTVETNQWLPSDTGPMMLPESMTTALVPVDGNSSFNIKML